MADERPGAEASGEPKVKVTDRRRFTAEGEVVGGEGAGAVPEGSGSAASAAAGELGPDVAAAAPPDPRDAQLAAQAARIDELTRAYAALLEDNKAFRARLEREKARVVEAERASVAQALLEASDDLERALAAVSGADGGGEALRNLAEGVRLSLGAVHRRIAALGAERLQVTGGPFDPHVAEAVDTVAVADEAQDGKVLQEVRAGYRIGERVLRPARVRVGRLARA